jgi:hypothetical protein
MTRIESHRRVHDPGSSGQQGRLLRDENRPQIGSVYYLDLVPGKPPGSGTVTTPVVGEPQFVRATMPSISEAEKARKVLERMFPASATLSNAATANSSSG